MCEASDGFRITKEKLGGFPGGARELVFMISRRSGAVGRRWRWRACSVAAALVLAIGWVAPCTGSTADRAVLGAVTPDTLGVGEEITVRWNYEDGNGGRHDDFSKCRYASLRPYVCKCMFLQQ